MQTFTRLLDLLEKADYAGYCNCRTTTLAYMKMATEEWYRQIADGRTEIERERLTEAALYVDRLIKRYRSFSKAATLAYDFWLGFESGWNNRTQPQRTKAAWQRGYRYGARRRPA